MLITFWALIIILIIILGIVISQLLGNKIYDGAKKLNNSYYENGNKEENVEDVRKE